MVDLALSSMALVIFARTQQHPPAAVEASSKYQRLLQVAQERIRHIETPRLDEGDIDACLLAVFLMGRYEGAIFRPNDLISEDSFLSLQSWSHHNGAMAILKLWSDSLSHNTATPIIKQTRRGLIRSCLLRNVPLPDWMLNGVRFGEHGMALEYDRIVVRMVNLHYACANLQQKNGLEVVKTEELSNEARELDETLQDWAAQIPSECSYKQHVLIEPNFWPKRHFYSSTVYSYSDPANAAAWGQYFSARMLISSILLRILELSRPSPLADTTYERKQLECITQLRFMTDSLASTIPFCLERIKVNDANVPMHQVSITLNTKEDIKPHLASLVVWPLTIASNLKGIEPKQQSWFRSELAWIGRITGDGVLECAETNQWALLDRRF